jgi:dephospho-CoA kinase
MVESARILETKYGGEDGWQKRLDRNVIVKAPEDEKIARFVARSAGGRALDNEERTALEAEARRRMANQAETERNAEACDFVLVNDGSLEGLQAQVDAVWPALRDAAKGRAG